MKKGISIITIIITCIVVIILAAAVLLSLNDINIIDKAKEAGILNDISMYEEELNMYNMNQLLDNLSTYDLDNLNADSTSLNGDTSDNIFSIIPSLKNTEFEDDIIIQNGNLIYTGSDEEVLSIIPTKNIQDSDAAGTIDVSTSDWTNEDVTVTINFDPDITDKTYKIGDGEFTSYTEPFTVPSNSKVVAKGNDADGNVKISSVDINKIDKDLPTGTFDPAVDNTYTLTKNILFNPSDIGGSGVSKWKYRISIDDGSYSDWYPDILGDTTDGIPLSVVGANKIEVEVTDNASNTKTLTSNIYNIGEESAQAPDNGVVQDINLVDLKYLENYIFRSVIKVSDGYIAAGNVVAKFNNNLELVSVNDNINFEYITNIIEDDGAYIACGRQYDPSDDSGFMVGKFDYNLNEITTERIIYGQTYYNQDDDDLLYKIKNIDTGYLICGYHNRSNDSAIVRGNYYIGKLNKDFEIQNEYFAGISSETERFYDIIEVSDGYIAVGSSTRTLSNNSDFIMRKFDFDLNLVDLAVQDMGYNSICINSILQVSDGYVVGGYNGYMFLIAKFDTDLELVKMNNYGSSSYSSGNKKLYEMIKVNDGFVAVGASEANLTSLTGGDVTQGDDDFVIAKFDSDINLEKIQNFGGTRDDILYSIVKSTNGYVAVGTTKSNLTHLRRKF